MERTELSDLGEFKLIEKLTSKFKTYHPSTVRGVGDDAAVIKNRSGLTVVTTDLLLEGVHFDLSYFPLKHLGYKSVMVNLSDVCAMNGKTEQITVSIALSNRFSLEAVEELYEGIRYACSYAEIDLIGGDTSTSLKGLVISVTAIGTVDEKKITYRKGAKAGDIICVSGDLGAAYTGLQLLEREKQIFIENPDIQPDLENQEHIVGKFLKPDARMDIVKLLAELEIVPTSMIDVSDGLSSDLLHICHHSNVGCKLFESKIPIHGDTYNMALKFQHDPTTCALNGGEDYELLFTIDPAELNKFTEDHNVRAIGEITDKAHGYKLISKSNNEHDLIAQGWQHMNQ
ncbi:MAG: thiamine-phosphate kinase [Chitinophagales bacterium]|nr:thiamine-phosphate kinase [Chitinophagales bacterium]